MANFKDLVKYQRSQGKGVIGSLGTALGQKSLEKLDPRNYLFSRTGLMTALFSSLKGYQAKTSSGRDARQMQQVLTPSPIFDKENSDKLSRIDINTKLSAKNSMVLPMMARDMNLMRLNLQKLVTISGGTASNKADMFFKRAAERESMYESAFKKNNIYSTKPTSAKTAPESKGGGFLSSILDFIPSFLKGLLAGGLITALIGFLAQNEELRNVMKNAFVGILTGFFNFVRDGFNFIGDVLKTKEVRESIQGAITSFVNVVTDFTKTILNTKLGEFAGIDITIGKAIAGVVGAFVGFKLAIIALTAFIESRIGGMGLPVPGGGAGRAGKLGAFFKNVIKKGGKLALVGAGLYAAYKLANPDDDISEEEFNRQAQQYGQNQTDEPTQSATDIEQRRSLSEIAMDRGGELGLKSIEAVGDAAIAKGAYNIAASRAAKAPTPMTSTTEALRAYQTRGAVGTHGVHSKAYENIAEIMKKVASKSPAFMNKFWEKVRVKLQRGIALKLMAVFAGIVAAPLTAGVSTLISIFSGILLIQDVIQIAKILGEIYDELEGEEKMAQMEVEITSPTLMNYAVTPGAGEFDTGSMIEPTKTMKVSTISKADDDREMKKLMQQQKSALERTASQTPATTPSPVSSDYANRIGAYESGGHYDTVYDKAGGAKINGKLVTENTIAEVAAWQDSERKKKTNRHAAGKYQFMDVRGAAANAGIGLNELFNAQNQDKMMEAFTSKNAEYLKGRGIDPSTENLAMAHAVGAGGAAALLTAQKSGAGSTNALDVLGLTGAARTTNPHLNKSVNEVVASLQSRGKGTSTPGVTPTSPKEEKPTMLAGLFSKSPQEAMSGILSMKPDEAISAMKNLLPNLGPLGERLASDLSRVATREKMTALGDEMKEMERQRQEKMREVVIAPTPATTQQNQNPMPITLADAGGVVDTQFANALLRRAADGPLIGNNG